MRRLAALLALMLCAGTAQATQRGIWITTCEIMAGDTMSTAWQNLAAYARGAWPSADLGVQDKVHAGYCVAGAIVGIKTNNTVIKDRVVAGILAAKRSLDTYEERFDDGCAPDNADHSACPRGLSVGRQLYGYCIAADIIDLAIYDSTANNEFVAWLPGALTFNLPRNYNNNSTCVNDSANNDCSVRQEREQYCSNWSAYCGATMAAAYWYLNILGDDGLGREANRFRAYAGERSYYPKGKASFWTMAGAACFQCNPATWTPINPTPCNLSGMDGSGALVDDANRGPNATPMGAGCPPGIGATGINYTWQALDGVFIEAEILARKGYDSFGWSNQAVRRALDFAIRVSIGNATYAIAGNETYKDLCWIANYRYGPTFKYATYPTTTGGQGYGYAYTDWTHSVKRNCAPYVAKVVGRGVRKDTGVIEPP